MAQSNRFRFILPALVIALLVIPPPTAPAQLLVCRREGIEDHEREERKAKSIIGLTTTSNMSRMKIYITVNGDELYAHSNFVTPSFEHPTKIATDQRVGLDNLVRYLVFYGAPGSAEIDRMRKDIRKNIQFVVDPDARLWGNRHRALIAEIDRVITRRTNPAFIVPSVTSPDLVDIPTISRVDVPGLPAQPSPVAESTAGTASSSTPDLPPLVLSVKPAGNEFAVRVTPRERIGNEQFARSLNDGQDPTVVFGGEPRVAAVVKRSGGDYFQIWLKKSDHSTQLHRVENAGKTTFEVVITDTPSPPDPFADAEYLRLDLTLPPDQRVFIDANARGPPPAEGSVVHDHVRFQQHPGSRFPGWQVGVHQG